jgi:hypothetical protein
MVTVAYPFQFSYAHDETGRPFPMLQIKVEDPKRRLAVEVDAYLDSGAEGSLFDGHIAGLVGLELLDGRRRAYESASARNPRIEARLHEVLLSHPDLGSFPLEVGFSVGDVRRNLLGRDFFDLIQVGSREHQLTFYITPSP